MVLRAMIFWRVASAGPITPLGYCFTGVAYAAVEKSVYQTLWSLGHQLGQRSFSGLGLSTWNSGEAMWLSDGHKLPWTNKS